MTLWEPFKLLFPGYAMFWAFSFLLAAGFWYGWTRVFQKMHFTWQAPALLSTFCSLIFCGFHFMTVYNGSVLYTAQQNAQQSSQTAQNNNADPALQMKAGFLNSVEKFLQDPSKFTPESKKALFKEFSALFPNAEAKKSYKEAIAAVYNCQRTFWEDALATFKTGRAVKSDSRKQCESMSGAFFNREKMLPAEAVKNNEKIMEEIANHRRVPASDGKSMEVNEKMVQEAVQSQITALNLIDKIFD